MHITVFSLSLILHLHDIGRVREPNPSGCHGRWDTDGMFVMAPERNTSKMHPINPQESEDDTFLHDMHNSQSITQSSL